MPEFSVLIWIALAFAALLVGISKTALPGVNTISVAIFAAAMPARASTGALLLLLIVGDMFAVATYWRQANWRILRALASPILVGLIAGALFLAFFDDQVVQRVIGAILLAVVITGLIQRHRRQRAAVSGRDENERSQPSTPDSTRQGSGERGRAAGYGRQAGTPANDESQSIAKQGVRPNPNQLPQNQSETGERVQWNALGYGFLGGFTTMVANAAGPVMSMYFLVSRLQVMTFLGTAAWLFMVVNLMKLPFSIGIGIVTLDTLPLVAVLIPMVVIGGFVGRALAGRIRQQAFERYVIVLTIIGATYLLLA